MEEEITKLSKENSDLKCLVNMYREHFETFGTTETFHGFIEERMRADNLAYQGELGHVLYERDRTLIYLLDMHEFYDRGLISFLKGVSHPSIHIDHLIMHGRELVYQSIQGMEPGVIGPSYTTQDNQTTAPPITNTFETGGSSIPQYVPTPFEEYPGIMNTAIDQNPLMIKDYLLQSPEFEFLPDLMWENFGIDELIPITVLPENENVNERSYEPGPVEPYTSLPNTDQNVTMGTTGTNEGSSPTTFIDLSDDE